MKFVTKFCKKWVLTNVLVQTPKLWFPYSPEKHFFSRYNMFLLIKSCEIFNFGLIGVEPLYRVLKGIFKPAFRVPSTQTLVKIYNKYVSIIRR